MVCFVSAAVAQEAPKAAKKAAPASAPRKVAAAATAAAATAGSVQIPKNAREVEPGLFEARDASGKTWHYTRTPFGVRKFPPQKPAESASLISEEADRIISAVEEGGKVHFERKTPFGSAKWSKTRAEMNDAEKLAFRRLTHVRNASPAARKSATAAAKPAAQE